FLSGAQPFGDDRHRADLPCRLHRPDLELPVGSDHSHLIVALELVDGSRGNEEGILLRLDRGPDPPVLARAEDLARVGERALDGDGSRLRAELPVDGVNAAPAGIDAAVLENELQGRDVPEAGLGPVVALL